MTRPASALIRSSERVSVARIVELLDMLAGDLERAEAGDTVNINTWLDGLHKDRHQCHALVRTLFLITSVYRITSQDIHDLRVMVKNTDQKRREPTPRTKETGERLSPRIF